MTANRLDWRIVFREQPRSRPHPTIKRIVTPRPVLWDSEMPPEIGLLLPNRDGQGAIASLLAETGDWSGTDGIGLFLADPFLNLPATAERLLASGVGWVTYLPSVDLHDPEFSRQLGDVGLDLSRELARLGSMKERGFHTAATLSRPEGCATAVANGGVDAVIVMPRVGDFSVGFPSLRKRNATVQAVRSRLTELGWNGPLIGLADETECTHQALWPDALDGVILRTTVE